MRQGKGVLRHAKGWTLMADRKMKQMFREAADVARTVPPEFRQAAFNRALDMLSGIDRPRVNGDSGTPVPPVPKRGITGFAAPDYLLDRTLDAVGFAAEKLGMESVTAEEVAEILQDRFGIKTPADMVATALNATGVVARTANFGGRTLYRIVTTPTRGARAKAAPKKPAAKRKLKRGGTPGEIMQDLIALGFFASAKTTADVLLYIEKQGLQLTARQITPVLTALMRGGALSAAKTRDGRYQYWADEE